DPQVLRKRKNAGVQSRTPLLGGHERRLAPTVFHGVPKISIGRSRPHGGRIYEDQHLRRMLRLDSFLPRQDVSQVAARKHEGISVYKRLVITAIGWEHTPPRQSEKYGERPKIWSCRYFGASINSLYMPYYSFKLVALPADALP